jgi:hypothetical protein
MGDFIEGSSDYDMLVVLSGELSSADLRRLAKLHSASWTSSCKRSARTATTSGILSSVTG